jgi:4-hydroxy-tetrahydrodipicolinate reductase
MKVCLIGYGKMGKAIEEILLQKSHEISGRIDHANSSQLKEFLAASDVAIEFTGPDAVVEHLKLCFDLNVPVICGTTGWLDKWKDINAYLENKKGSMIYASNFSVGVQLFFALNKKLAGLMSKQFNYQCELKEIHHIHKKDAPSGTAITLAQDLINNNPRYTQWKLNESNIQSDLKIISERTNSVVGTHIVTYTSPIDQIEITHEAFSRQGFAQGAVLAAEWILGKQGMFTMNDVLGI